MKTKLFLLGAALWLASCGTSSTQGWRTDDLRYIPFGDMGDDWTYVDLKSNVQPGWNWSIEATLFYDGYAVVGSDEKGDFGFMDKKGVVMNGTFYSDVTIFHEGIAWVARPGKPMAAIDKKGNILFEMKQAETVYAFHEGLAAFSNADGLWGLVNKKGVVVVEPCWLSVAPMVVNGMIAAEGLDFGWGLADKSGNWIVLGFSQVGSWDVEENTCYNYEQALAEGRIPVKDGNGKWGLIDQTGRSIINPQFDEIILGGKNYLFKKGRQWGWCDKNGQYLINPQFKGALPFGEADLAAVQDKNGDWGFIDKDGLWMISPRFRDADAFLPCGIAAVREEDSRDWGAVDKNGRWVINPQFRGLYRFGADDRLLALDQSGEFAIIDAAGKYLSPSFPDARKELIRNATGVGAKYEATSDYVDVESYAALIDAEIHTLKSTTTEGLKSTYGLSEAKFPKGGGKITLYSRKQAAKEMTFQLSVVGVDAWRKASDGWFGYNYTFLPDVPVNSYTFTVEFERRGKAGRFVTEIFDVLKSKYAYDEEQNLLTIPGYAMVFAAPIPNGGIIFQVKPE